MPDTARAASSILLVDDDAGSIQLMAKILMGVAQLRFATHPEDALRLALEDPPDLFLLDAEMPGMSGFDLCRRLKSEPSLSEVPVVFVTSHGEPEFEAEGFALGAADFIAKPVNAPLVLARVKSQLKFKRMADELREIARRDALTGVANRRAFDETLAREWRRAMRNGDALALLLVDVDHFKLYNDRYGHPAGDVCLRRVAEALSQACNRPGDLVARYGGEEFVLLLTQTEREGAEHMAHRILDVIEALQIMHEGSLVSRHVTVSVGVSTYDASSPAWIGATAQSRDAEPFSPNAAELVAAADAALYGAKKGGRANACLLDIARFAQPEGVEELDPQHRPRR